MLQNKWNGKTYEVIKDEGKQVVLECTESKTVIQIDKSELNFSYREYKEKKKCH